MDFRDNVYDVAPLTVSEFALASTITNEQRRIWLVQIS